MQVQQSKQIECQTPTVSAAQLTDSTTTWRQFNVCFSALTTYQLVYS